MEPEPTRPTDKTRSHYPQFRSHFLPRTRAGLRVIIVFCALFVLVEPPLLSFANRIEPWMAEIPALYLYLSVVYFALISLLVWTYLQDL